MLASGRAVDVQAQDFAGRPHHEAPSSAREGKADLCPFCCATNLDFNTSRAQIGPQIGALCSDCCLRVSYRAPTLPSYGHDSGPIRAFRRLDVPGRYGYFL